MNGQTIIITGGSSGMGLGMAKRFAADGANVVITGRNKDKLEEAKKEISKQDDQVLCIPMDVRKPDDVARMVEETKSRFGRIDHLVNNAAGNFIVNAEDLSINGWHAVIDIVLHGTFYCSQAVGKEWIKNGQKGTILNMLATYAYTGAAPGVIHSASAKAGVWAMTKTLAVEWGQKYGIRVNAIAPGPIERTGGADRLWESKEAEERTINSVPIKRLGTPEEVAALAAFILSDEASYINGECITMDGGQVLATKSFL